ncbi:hypothetical protein [Roseibium marinum]|uniref:Nickel/cobalt efflux system n=1 Tax=Roseibium marinum TaxID=281252 RepID=A0A2S3V424_9HYPH|nr:hypothetical protein [Roseibium marinum]POF34523.1 hypothetical protein CLV41_101979 [Roseibium marinum]
MSAARFSFLVLGIFLAVAGGLAGGLGGGLAGGAGFLSLGFAIGMAHALEADHLAAVATMFDRGRGLLPLMKRGAVWGLGHTLSLFLICGTVLALGLTISGRVEASLELAVGVMIVILGLRVFWKLLRARIHIHVHTHGGLRHTHAHSHALDREAHGQSAHQHGHAPMRSYLPVLGIGLLHGAAGSAGLLVLTVATTESFAEAVSYFALFGVGSLAGMAALSALASVPLRFVDRGASWMKTATAASIGILAIWVGGSLALGSVQALQAAGL